MNYDTNRNAYNRRRNPVYIEKRLADAKRIITNENLPPELSYDILKRVPGEKLVQFCTLDNKTRERCNDIGIWNDKVENDFGLSIPSYVNVIDYVKQLYSPASYWDYYLEIFYIIDQHDRVLDAELYHYMLLVSSLVLNEYNISIDVENSYIEDVVINKKLRGYNLYLKVTPNEIYKYGNMLNLLQNIIIKNITTKDITNLKYKIVNKDEVGNDWYRIEVKNYTDASNSSGIMERYYFYDMSSLLHIIDREDNEETYEIVDLSNQ
ncbi:F-box domain-containing protein [Orpheovirus IHUMI-LCC2]|uniref:F-box domain-containing protein n=1 Tax=Orpheovirus IHUMI-LCC2 TaxID=2023057 RepID=A0A2I2L400_9VIRU|nr:F-box domain-containing protein [Orpheovirus IHUMI-LCC2]SNW62247.1 F-box domain-containing protein [Orpheovirus IHUMI-LCC2]